MNNNNDNETKEKIDEIVDETSNEEKTTTEDIKKDIESSTSALKNEALETVDQVKETLKTINIKEDTNVAKGFIKEMWQNPLGVLKEATLDWKKFMRIAILLLLASIVVTAITELLLTFTRSYYDFNLSRIISIARISFRTLITLVTLTSITYFIKKDKKLNFMNIFTVLIIAYTPNLLYRIFNVISILGSSTSILAPSISALCGSISTVLTYFALKFLFEEDDDSIFLRKYVTIQAILFVVNIVLSLIGIR